MNARFRECKGWNAVLVQCSTSRCLWCISLSMLISLRCVVPHLAPLTPEVSAGLPLLWLVLLLLHACGLVPGVFGCWCLWAGSCMCNVCSTQQRQCLCSVVLCCFVVHVPKRLAIFSFASMLDCGCGYALWQIGVAFLSAACNDLPLWPAQLCDLNGL